jgi:hypothetical protein
MTSADRLSLTERRCDNLSRRTNALLRHIPQSCIGIAAARADLADGSFGGESPAPEAARRGVSACREVVKARM